MLSDKLLSKTDYNCEREIRTLELLKLRFGETNLHSCEVSFAVSAEHVNTRQICFAHRHASHVTCCANLVCF